MQTKILLTGGSGLLGTELQKHLRCYAPSSKELNILHCKRFKYDPDIVIHSAAYTDVPKAEKQRKLCYDLNVLGTVKLLNKYPSAYFIFISSEYANNPVNFYSHTKLWAEQMVQGIRKTEQNYLIIRTLFKPKPFPFPNAFIDQYTIGDYVDVIAPMIVDVITRGERGIVSIGTGRKTIYQLAKQTRPDVAMISVNDIKEVKLPKDYLTISE